MPGLIANNIESLGGSIKPIKNIVAKVNSISDLLNIDTSKLDDKEQFHVLGFHEPNDGGGGIFYWDANEDKSNHNGGTIISPDAIFPSDWSDTGQQSVWFTSGGTGNGCWKRVVGDYVTPEMFGAKGGGVTDDTEAIQKAVDFYTHIFLNKNIYKTSSTIVLPARFTYIFGRSLFDAGYNAPSSEATVIYNVSEDYAFKDSGASNTRLHLRDIVVDCDNTGAGIYLADSTDSIGQSLTLERTVIRRVGNTIDGIYIGKNRNGIKAIWSMVLGGKCGIKCIEVTDFNAYQLGVGNAVEYGYYFEKCAAFRFTNCDVWYAENGIYLDSCIHMSFIDCQLNDNNKVDIKINDTYFTSAKCLFTNCVFVGSKTESVYNIDINGAYTPDISFVNCSFGRYEDDSSNWLGCIVDNCSNKRSIVAVANVIQSSYPEFINGTCKTIFLNRKSDGSYFDGNVYTKINDNAIWNPVQQCGVAIEDSDFTNSDCKRLILANASDGNMTITLPDPQSLPSGIEFIVKKTDSSSNTVTIVTENSRYIEGVQSRTLSSKYEFLRVISDGWNYFKI